MEKTKEAGKKNGWPVWGTIVIILLWLIGLTFWVQYERTQSEKTRKESVVLEKPILHISEQTKADVLCECPKPKVKASHKKQKLKPVIRKEVKSKPVTIVPSVAVVAHPKFEVATLSQKEDFYDNAVMPKTWVTEPKEEVVTEPPRVGRKILVIRQQPVMSYPYYGGYSPGYYSSYVPQVTYGQPYVPPPQTVFVPAPPVIVPAPSVVTPAGGYRPQGSTGGHSPSGTTGTAL